MVDDDGGAIFFSLCRNMCVFLEQWFVLFLLNEIAQGSLSIYPFVSDLSVTLVKPS